MPKIRIAFSQTSLELKGSSSYLRSELPAILKMVNAQQNARSRDELGSHLDLLEVFRRDMSGSVDAMQQTNRESLDLWNRFMAAVDDYRREVGAAAGGGSQQELLNATKQMQETQMSFNLQYLQLQSQMQHENRSYTAISNIMKTKHDTVKNSISNIR